MGEPATLLPEEADKAGGDKGGQVNTGKEGQDGEGEAKKREVGGHLEGVVELAALEVSQVLENSPELPGVTHESGGLPLVLPELANLVLGEEGVGGRRVEGGENIGGVITGVGHDDLASRVLGDEIVDGVDLSTDNHMAVIAVMVLEDLSA